ncbi:MAG: VOC family protein [Acidimicrobiales bacterium]
MSEPFDHPLEQLADDVAMAPSAAFVAELRSRLELELLPPVPTGAGPDPTIRRTTTVSPILPYLTVHDGNAAIDFYRRAFDAVEEFRVPMDDGRLGHAELTIAGARVMMSDEYPEMGVTAPPTIGGTSVALHVTVADVDAVYAQALAEGATGLQEPADQPHGARHGTIRDPFGHRWMLSQTLEEFDLDTYASRAEGTEFSVERPYRDGIWAALAANDARALIRFYVEVLGFAERIVVPAEDAPDEVAHSELVWPEGGVVQIGTAGAGTLGPERVGAGTLYVISDDPAAVHERCVAAGVEITRSLESPDYDAGGAMFGLVDPEGNSVTVGTYRG